MSAPRWSQRVARSPCAGVLRAQVTGERGELRVRVVWRARLTPSELVQRGHAVDGRNAAGDATRVSEARATHGAVAAVAQSSAHRDFDTNADGV